MTRVGFIVNAREKENYVYRCVQGALAQTYPCSIVLSDQFSSDRTLAEMKRAVAECTRGADHEVSIVQCPIDGPFSMESANSHVAWLWQQTPEDCELILQCSADDYSLADRAKICVEAYEANPCSAVACTMFFEKPGEINRQNVSGYPRQSGYVSAGDGLLNLAYGSTIGGYSREFLAKYAALAGEHTPDVLFGWLAALDKGFYVVANPQHVHCEVASLTNMGFQGKMRAATGDDVFRVGELNRFQLTALYDRCMTLAQEHHPEGIQQEAIHAVTNMTFANARGWLEARKVLHQRRITPGIL